MKKKKRENVNDRFPKVSTKTIWLTGLTIILILLLGGLITHIVMKRNQKIAFEQAYLPFAEKNQTSVFSVDQIVFFSSSDAKTKASSKSNFTMEHIYTYTDIAIFLSRHSDELTRENTLKEAKITHMEITKKPEIGTPHLYFKGLPNFAKSMIPDSQAINNDFTFTISSEESSDLTQPILYNNCANPITLSYVNESIKNDYTITDTSNPITYDGSLLKRCNISLDSLSTSLSLTIELTNHLEQKFRTTLSFTIPYEEQEQSINDGSITVKKDIHSYFYRYE